MTNKYTSLPLSKKLEKGGCKIKGEYSYDNTKKIYLANTIPERIKKYPAYDLLWDICIKHAREFFGEEGKDDENDE